MAVLILLTALRGLTTAAPQSKATSCTEEQSSPTSTTSPNFYLVANVTSHDLQPSIQNWAVSSYHVGACLSVAVLEPNDAQYHRAFYANGTSDQVRDGKRDILTDGATPLTPYGFIVPPANVTPSNDRIVSINCGDGTLGVAITRDPEPLHLTYTERDGGEFGSWYACNSSLPFGPAVALYYRDQDAETPQDCAEVTLLPEWYVSLRIQMNRR